MAAEEKHHSNAQAVSVISSFSVDRIVSKDGATAVEQRGGPALYIGAALRDGGVPFVVYAGEPFVVEITPTETGEVGRVVSGPSPSPVTQDMLQEWTILSAIAAEWTLDPALKLPGRLFVDIQGYTRNPTMLGGKRQWRQVAEFAQRVFCLKGTREEVSYLPPEVFEAQKKRLLIITDGTHDVEVYDHGEYHRFPVKRIRTATTVGAGDTFLTYTMIALMQGCSVPQAVTRAVDQTAGFLQQGYRS